jgi:hypothetical protein
LAAARRHHCNDQNSDHKPELCPVLIVQLSPFVNRTEDESNWRFVANFVVPAPVSPSSRAAGIRSPPVLRTGQ